MARITRSWVAGIMGLALWGCGDSRSLTADTLATPAYNRSVAMLQTDARSPDPSVRANCIEALQMARDPRALDVIEQGLHDDQWVVRFAAAMAAGKRKDATVRPVLAAMVETDSNGSARVASIYALRRLGETAHMSELANAMESTDPSTRANTALVLGMLGDASAIPLLESRREEEDIRVRFELTVALARLGDEEAQKIVVGWAVNKFAEDQWRAMEACADLPASISASPLLLGLEGPPIVPPKPDQLSQAEVNALTTCRQLVAARSLAKMHSGPGEAAAKIAIDNLKNPNPKLRALAALTLGDMLTPDQIPGIMPLLDDPDDGVRRAAAAAIVNVFARLNPAA